MKNGVRILSAQLAELMLGKTLTVAEMHDILRKKYPGYDPASVWVALKTIKESVNCNLELTLKNQHRAYRLKSVSKKFFAHADRIHGHAEKKSRSPRRYFTTEEMKFIERVNEFDHLIGNVRVNKMVSN